MSALWVRPAAVVAVSVVLAGCGSGGAPVTTSVSGSCAAEIEVASGLAEDAGNSTYAMVLATVEAVEDAELVGGGDDGVVYTPLRLADVEPLAGDLPSDRVFVLGGTAEGMEVSNGNGPAVGVVPGARILLTVNVTGSNGVLPVPDGPYVVYALPVLDDGNVVVQGACLTVTDDTEAGVRASVPVPRLDAEQQVETVTEPQDLVPLAVLREAISSAK